MFVAARRAGDAPSSRAARAGLPRDSATRAITVRAVAMLAWAPRSRGGQHLKLSAQQAAASFGRASASLRQNPATCPVGPPGRRGAPAGSDRSAFGPRGGAPVVHHRPASRDGRRAVHRPRPRAELPRANCGAEPDTGNRASTSARAPVDIKFTTRRIRSESRCPPDRRRDSLSGRSARWRAGRPPPAPQPGIRPVPP